MPELPEVETVRRTLAPAIGMRVTRVWTSGKPLRLNQPVARDQIQRAAVDRRIEDIRRWGKYLLIDVAAGPTSILVHLGMSGSLRLMKPADPRPPHTHVVFTLARGRSQRELRYADPRRFGQVAPIERGAEAEHPSLARLGVDPLLGELTGEHLYQHARRSRRTLKALLLDQSVIAGIGNIYASEALWQARIHPGMRGHRLSRARAGELARAVREVLERALVNGGTSLRDYVDGNGDSGSHAHYLWVYDREGEPCMRPECGQPIRRQVIQGRSTFYCAGCQRR